jgi:hypothetical protein
MLTSLILLASYVNKHIERKIRAIDGYYNPFGRYTLQDYKNLKAGLGNGNELDPESREDKVNSVEILRTIPFKIFLINFKQIQKAQRRKEAGDFFMKSNPQQKNTSRKHNGNSFENKTPRNKMNGARSDPELPRIKHKNGDNHMKNQNENYSNNYPNPNANSSNFNTNNTNGYNNFNSNLNSYPNSNFNSNNYSGFLNNDDFLNTNGSYNPNAQQQLNSLYNQNYPPNYYQNQFYTNSNYNNPNNDISGSNGNFDVDDEANSQPKDARTRV